MQAKEAIVGVLTGGFDALEDWRATLRVMEITLSASATHMRQPTGPNLGSKYPITSLPECCVKQSGKCFSYSTVCIFKN
ncbi:MAG: hypothetical protein ABSD74_14755 [Rhizomicrobium sp.]|jgi:hypothetical protein